MIFDEAHHIHDKNIRVLFGDKPLERGLVGKTEFYTATPYNN